GLLAACSRAPSRKTRSASAALCDAQRRPGIGHLLGGTERDADLRAGRVLLAVAIAQAQALRLAFVDEVVRIAVAQCTRRLQRPVRIVHELACERDEIRMALAQD